MHVKIVKEILDLKWYKFNFEDLRYLGTYVEKSNLKPKCFSKNLTKKVDDMGRFMILSKRAIWNKLCNAS